jgi:hypothetical protein
MGHGLLSALVIGTLCTAMFGLALVLGIFDSLGEWTQTTFPEVVATIGMLSFLLVLAFEILDKMYEYVEGRFVIESQLNKVFGHFDGEVPFWSGRFLSHIFTTVILFALMFSGWCFIGIMTGGIDMVWLIITFIICLYVALPDTGNDYWLLGLWVFCVIVGMSYGWINITEWFKSQTVIIPLIQGFLGGI